MLRWKSVMGMDSYRLDRFITRFRWDYRVLCATCHITPVLFHLHWLPVQLITFKAFYLIHKGATPDSRLKAGINVLNMGCSWLVGRKTCIHRIRLNTSALNCLVPACCWSLNAVYPILSTSLCRFRPAPAVLLPLSSALELFVCVYFSFLSYLIVVDVS